MPPVMEKDMSQEMMLSHPEIALVDPSTLSLLGLKSIMEPILENVTIRCFNSFAELMDDTPDAYFHYFVALPVFFEHTEFFLSRRQRTIVLTTSASQSIQSMRTLDVSQPAHELVRALVGLYRIAHRMGHPAQRAHRLQDRERSILTERETQVLALIARGCKNREIAQRLNIALTTVITHRRNLIEKLGIRSASALAVWAIMQGIVEADAL